MQAAFSFPEWLTDRIPDDSRFADAYDSTPADRRALLKTCIARLWEWWGASVVRQRRTIMEYRAGFSSEDSAVPVDYCIVFVDDAAQSPARLIAALAPALCAGVSRVLAVHVGQGWTPEQLTALELIGQEDAVEITSDEALGLLNELTDEGGQGVVLCLGSAMAECLDDPSLVLWREKHGTVLATGAEVDMSALEFMHPEGVEHVESFSDFSGGRVSAVFGATFDGGANCIAPFAAGPGMEACWVHVDLPRDFFFKHSVRWTMEGAS